MFKLPDHIHSNVPHTSLSDKYTSEFEAEDVNVWTKFFDREQMLNDEDRNRINHIFNKLVINIVKYEREQDFQLLEALSKRLLSTDREKEENKEEQWILTAFDQERLIKLRTICKRLKHYNSTDKLLSTMFTQDKSSELTLPPIGKTSHQTRSSSLSFDDTHIALPVKKRQRMSEIDSPVATHSKSKRIMMHGPVTLQNIYQALPAATFQFAQDEYVWHANRPVNMILATGVQLPNVLTESATNTNIESEQFFSKIIEDIIAEYQQRNPSDHYSALKHWKQKHENDSYTQSITPRRMNGFETLVDVVQRRHLGKLQRYFLNVVSTNRHYNPYDLITVPEYKVDPNNHYVFSVFGILNVRQNGLDVEFYELAEWYKHAKLWHACRQIPFFRDYLIRKQFNLWLSNARFSRFARRRSEIEEKHLLLMNNRIFQMAVLEIRRVITEYQRLTLLPKLFEGMSLSLNNFETMVKRHTKDTLEYTKKFFNHIKTIVDMTRETCGKKLHVILKCLEEDHLTFNSSSGSIYEQRIRKENLRKELEQMQKDIRNICPFLNLCSAMLASCLCDIQRETLSQFVLSNATFLTKLHLSDFDSNRMLRYLPSCDDYFEIFQSILQQPQQMLYEQWKTSLELDTCLKDVDKFGDTIRQEGLTSQCEKCGQNLYPGLQETSSNSCQCKKQQSKGSSNESNNLSIKGHGFFGSTNRNEVLPFEVIFTKDMKYKEEIKKILSQFRLSFDELDNYCDSNEWLCEINRFCLQWTPNQMKQMSEEKQVFLIEEQLNLLRGWIDKTRTFELNYSTSHSPYILQMDCSVISQDLCNKIERIYLDFGKYLYRYTCTNVQILIEKFQNALQVFDQQPSAIEEFAKYASYLVPHKNELSSNQQSIEYFTSLFELIYMHFGHLRQENENELVDKLLTDTWKLFQKKLSDAADFVAQQTLIIKERLRDTFEKYLNEAELLYNQSTSGIFLDPTQDPMEMVKQLKKNCIDFLGLEKKLRQYAEWRTLLAANSSISPSEDEVDSTDINNVSQWSTEIDLRKDLWKYVEITSSSIKEWKNTFINKFNIRRAQEKIECWLKIAEDFKEKVSEDDPVVLHWINILEDFEQNIDLLKKLLSDAMTAEQWKLLFRANGYDYDPQYNYRIQDLIDLNILQIQNQDVFIQIHKQATREQKLKDKLIHMQTWLNELHYRMAKYRPALKTTPVRNRITSSYRQRLSRYRELRSRTPTAGQTSPSETIVATETSTEVVEEAYIMINSQEILRLIEDRLLLLHSNESFHGNIDSRREQFQQYYTLFDNVKEMTQLWFETQNKWIFLRSALANLSGTNDDQTFLKQIYLKFTDIDESFRNFQKLAFQNPSVAGLAKVEMNRIHFKTWLNLFDELVTELDFYLNEQYRAKFGRFYFLSNDDLVHLISFGLDPRFYIPYVRQLFKGIHNIQFRLPEQNIGATTNQAINSAATDVYAYRLEVMSISNVYNEELSFVSKLKLVLPTIDTGTLSTHLISSQSLTKWFQSLEKLMKYSLSKLIFNLFDKKMNEQMEEILFKQTIINSGENSPTIEYPLQVILLVEHILFGLILEKQIEKKAKLFVRNLKFKIEDQINALISNQTKQQKSLIIQRLYFRDILSRLINIENDLTLSSYEWLSLIKYQIDRTENKIHFLQFSNRIQYQFEFIEPSSTFIISPMMERTLFQLTQAVSAYRIGVVHAPSQYGRSSVVQTLAQLCGINCLSLLCDSSMEVNQIGNYHQGLITSNSWCLFKNIHRLSIDCMSSLAIAMRHIRVQLEERQTLFNNSSQSLKRFKSQSDITDPSSSLHFNQINPRSNEYPLTKKVKTNFNCIITNNQEIIPYPLTYGLFATLDDHYRPLSSTIKFECRTISLSRPDLKIIAESLLYTNRLFTIKEQEDCRETAENLVHFIEYLQLIFDEIKSFCSPFILLRSIIEQSINMNIKEAIIIVLRRYQLYDSNIPQIIERFFIENSNESNEKDDELCFVDSLKQEAFDDKITFDDDEIFNDASRLMYALKRNDLIFITGQCGSAKSSLIRLVERTINKQMSTVNVNSAEDEGQKLVIINKVFPNAFDEEQFYRSKNSFIEQWKRYHTTTVATDKTSDQYWIILDIDSHSNWLTSDKIQYLYSELLSSLSHQDGSVKLLIECDQFPSDISDNCLMFDKVFILNLEKFQSRMKLIQSAVTNLELKLHLQDSTLSSIKDFINDVIEPYIEYIKKEHICDSHINNLTDSFIQILSSYIEQHLIDVQHHHHALNYMFTYCFIWAYVHPILPKYEEQVNSFVRQLLKSYDFPPLDCKLTDLYPDMNTSSSARFVSVRSWLKAHQISYDCIPEFEGTMRLMSMVISSNYPLGIYSHEQGFGKTTLMKRLLTNVHHLRLISTGEGTSLLSDELFKYNLPVFTHGKLNRGTKLRIWIEDVKQEDMELIRSWIDEHSSSKQQDLSIVITGESYYSYSSRFSRHFVPILINQSLSTLIGSIYSLPIKDWLEEFSVDAISHPIELAHACLLTLEEVFDFLKQYLNKIKWNLHHVESVVNGMLLLDGKVKRAGLGTQRELTKITARVNKKKQQDEQVATIIRLLCHELSRTILDQLTENKDRLLFQDFLYKTIIANFCTELEFHVVSTNDGEASINPPNDPNVPFVASQTVGKKQVKFKLGLVSDRAAMASLEGPIVPFGKLIGLPKIKDPSKITNPDDIIEKLFQLTYFSKQILPLHGDYIGDRHLYTNQYQESDVIQMSTALRSCQSRMGKLAYMDLSFIPRTCRHITNLVRVFCLPHNGHALLRTKHIGLGRQDLVQLAAYIVRHQYFNAHSYVPIIDENESVKQCLRSGCLLAGLKQKNLVVLVRENLLSNEMIKQLYVFTREGTYPGLYSNEELIRIAAALSPGLPTTRRVMKTNSVLKTFYARIRKRFHLVILENNQQLRHAGLLSSCYVDEYGYWAKDEIVSIAKYWMTNRIDTSHPFESISTIDLVSQALSEVYLSMDHFQQFTLKNIRKTIEFLFKFYESIQEREKNRLSRCVSMLNRSNKSERIIEMNNQLCIQLQNEIDILQEKLSKLNEEFKTKKNHFSVAVDDCREEEKLLHEMSIALDRLRQDVQADVEKANPQYENALSALRMLNKSDYDEIRTFRQPPQPVLAVMNTICIMFHRKPEWSEAKILMVKENFFEDLVFYDKDNMSDSVFDMLTQIIKFDTFRPSFVAVSSKAASGLCSWILAVYEYAKIARSQKTKLKQVKAYQELYNKRQHILGEKRLRAEKLKEELSQLIFERRSQSAEFQSKVKRLNSFQSTIDKTRSMLKLIDDDISHWQEQVKQGKLNKKTSITDALLTALYFCYLSQFNIDQRQQLLINWQTDILQKILPIRSNFNLLDIITNQKELNDYLLKQETSSSIADQNSILNGITLANQLDNTFVLFINNPEDDMSAWNDLLINLKNINGEKANDEIGLYYEYKQTHGIVTSANVRAESYQDRSQLYSRISSSKTYVTEVTEKSSLWESSTVASRPATSMLLTKSAGTVALSDLEQNKHLVSIPEFSLDEYQRPENNIIHLSGRQTEDFDKALLSAMFFGVIVIIDECDFLKLNPFLYRFLHWSSKRDQYLSTFPNLYRFGDQEIFINSSFRLILNFRKIDRNQWKNILLKNRLIDMSLSLNKIENDVWLRLVELKCQNNFTQQIRSNQRNHLITLNEQLQRQEKLIDILETKENLTIDSADLLTILNEFNHERILIENSLNEHRIQREILSSRTGSEAYRETARHLAQLYILIRDSKIELKIPIKWFIQIVTKNLSRRIETNTNINTTIDSLDMINKVQARESYLRCFESIYSYLSSALSNNDLQCLLIMFALIKQDNLDNLHLFRFILLKLNPINQQIIPNFLDDQKRPSFLNSHSWLLCLSDEINNKYSNLAQHLIQYQNQWKEYLFSTTKLDFLNKSPFEKTTSISIIDRFILWIILQPDKIFELIRTFLIYHYGGLLHDKSLCPIDDVYRLTSGEILKPANDIILVWISSSAFVDPIDEIRILANKMKQSVRLVSSIDKKRLHRFMKSKKKSWLIITDIHLFNDDLLQIRDFLLSSIDNMIWLICDPLYRNNVPHWLTQRCLQVYLSDSTQSSLYLRLQQKILSENNFSKSEIQIEQMIDVHTHLLSKKVFSNNWTNFIENDFYIDLKHCLETNMIDYTNYIQNEDEQTLINYIKQSADPSTVVKTLPDFSQSTSHDIFLTCERLFESLILSTEKIFSTKEDEMLLVESIVRSYLTHLRSTYSYQRLYSTCSSLIDLFVFNECQFLQTLENDLCNRMEYLLEVLAGIEIPSSNIDSFIRSILYDSNSTITNLVTNYGLALENLAKTTSNNVNMRFIRRRKQLIQVMRLEQARRQDDDLVFHLKYHPKSEVTNGLAVSGVHLTSTNHNNDVIICFDEMSSNDTVLMSVVTLDTIANKSTPSYLPVVHNDTKDKSELIILLSLDKPHI